MAKRASWMRSMLTCSYLGEEPENLLCDVPSLLAVGEGGHQPVGVSLQLGGWGSGEDSGDGLLGGGLEEGAGHTVTGTRAAGPASAWTADAESGLSRRSACHV